MNLIEKLAREYSDKCPCAGGCYHTDAFKAGFVKARDLAAESARTKPQRSCDYTPRSISADILRLGEQEI